MHCLMIPEAIFRVFSSDIFRKSKLKFEREPCKGDDFKTIEKSVSLQRPFNLSHGCFPIASNISCLYIIILITLRQKINTTWFYVHWQLWVHVHQCHGYSVFFLYVKKAPRRTIHHSSVVSRAGRATRRPSQGPVHLSLSPTLWLKCQSWQVGSIIWVMSSTTFQYCVYWEGGANHPTFYKLARNHMPYTFTANISFDNMQ
jgi:hypothetical protein